MIKTLVLIALAAVALAAQDANIEAVKKAAAQLEQALTHADMATLEKMVTDDFIRTPPGGRDTNKKEWLGLVESKRLQYVAFEDSEERYRSYGDTVIVNIVSNIHTRSSGGPERESTLKLIWVWVKLDGQWRLAAVQGNQVTAPAR
ncbi:MAG: nuclear transport factor 2 family protein [Acidobacteriia bacterium]|nr:nuclear transport factor 2 family protein [Terriglobia bacterium]